MSDRVFSVLHTPYYMLSSLIFSRIALDPSHLPQQRDSTQLFRQLSQLLLPKGTIHQELPQLPRPFFQLSQPFIMANRPRLPRLYRWLVQFLPAMNLCLQSVIILSIAVRLVFRQVSMAILWIAGKWTKTHLW